MATPKPLSYEGLKIVLQHMEANKKFKISKCCPSIKTAEKTVPLKLVCLELDALSIKVNDTTYSLGTYRKYPKGAQVPWLHQNDNDDGGSQEDLDRFGATERSSSEEFLMPGDIMIEEPIDDEEDDEEMIEDLMERGADEVTLQPYLNRRDNVLPVYEIMTQLTITSGTQDGNMREIERINKSSKLQEAMKYLTTSMFDERPHLIRVKALSFGAELEILRLPVGLKFKVRELSLGSHVADKLEALAPIFDEQTPLEVLRTRKQFGPNQTPAHQLERTTGKLCLEWRNKNLIPLSISTLPNREIHLDTYSIGIPKLTRLFERILKNWVEYGREIGVSFSFTVLPHLAARMMNEMMRVCVPFNGRKSGPRCIKVPLNFNSEVHITFELRENGTEGVFMVAVAAIDAQ